MSAREAGFTLLETLIGLTLTALISVSLLGGIRTGVKLWSTSEQLDAASEQSRILRLAGTWLEQAIPDEAMNAEPGTLFSGTGDAVSFVVAGEAGPHAGGLSRLTLKTETSETCAGKRDLVLSWASVAPIHGFPSQESVTRSIVTCLDQIDFKYFGSHVSEPSATWRSQWHQSARLPAIISMRAVGREGPLSLTVRPLLAPPARAFEREA